MVFYPESAVERAMKIQEVILRAMAKRLTWCQAAEIIGISDRQMRRWYRRYQEFGYDGLFDRRRGRPSPKRVAVETVERMLGLYRDRYFDLNVQHFCEKLREEHNVSLARAHCTSHRSAEIAELFGRKMNNSRNFCAAFVELEEDIEKA